MGRWNRKRGGRSGGRSDRRTLKRDFREPREGVWRVKKDGNGQIVMENQKFEEYYKLQGIVPEGEWDAFMETLKKPLPVTFRINGRGRFAEALRLSIESKWGSKEQEEENENIAPKCVSWYPGGLAWSISASRKDLRRDWELKKFHDFLNRETEVGSLSRQEAVSMIPPLFLDVKPHHKVLDMCASPGSKTFQILEMLHSDPEEPPSGLVIANDLDHVRCNLLTHQIKRMCSPSVMVTSHDASRFPNRRKKDSEEKILKFDRILCDVPCSGDGTLRKSLDIWSRWGVGNGNGLHIMQLRITLKACQLLKVGGRLVYSTCSLNPIEDEAVIAEVLRRTGGALRLVDVSEQLTELKRMPGLKQWRVSDRNSYAEVEEVRRMGGFKLTIDESFFPDEESDKMPLEYCMRVLPHHQDTGGFFVAVLELVTQLGRVEYPSAAHRWQDCDHPRTKSQHQHNNRGLEAEGAVPQSDLTEHEQQKGKETDQPTDEVGCETVHIPQGSGAAVDASEEVEAKMKCDPQAEEEGSAERKANDAAQVDIFESENNSRPEAQPDEKPSAEGSKGFRSSGDSLQIHKGVDPIIFLDDHPLVKQVMEFYGISDASFGQHLISRMLTNSKPRRVYTISNTIRELLREGCDSFLKIHAVGHKVLQRYDDKSMDQECIYRFCQEGLSLVLKHITKRILFVSVDDAIILLESRSLLLPKQSAATAKVEEEEGTHETVREKPIEDPRLLSQLEDFDDGGAIVMLRDEDAERLGLPLLREAKGGLTYNAPVALSCCRIRSRIKIMVGKQEASLILEKLRDAKLQHRNSGECVTDKGERTTEMIVESASGLKREKDDSEGIELAKASDTSKKQRLCDQSDVKE